MTIFVVLSLFLIVMVRKSLILKNLFNVQADYKTYKFLFLSVYILGNMRREYVIADSKCQKLNTSPVKFRFP